MKYATLQKELQGLEQIEKNQEKELEKLTLNQQPNSKIKELNEQLKSAKDRNKELEKKIQADTASYQKQHINLLDLQEKLQRLKEEKLQWRKAIAEKLPAPVDDKEGKETKKSEEEVLKNSIRSLKKRIEFERGVSKKNIESLKAELGQLQLQIKEAEQENRLNAAKLRELKPLLRHNQLKPLNAEQTETTEGRSGDVGGNEDHKEPSGEQRKTENKCQTDEEPPQSLSQDQPKPDSQS